MTTELSEKEMVLLEAFAIGIVPMIPLGFALEQYYGSVTAGFVSASVALAIIMVWNNYSYKKVDRSEGGGQ